MRAARVAIASHTRARPCSGVARLISGFRRFLELVALDETDGASDGMRYCHGRADGSDLVFAEWHGGTREPSTVRARLARLCKAADVPTLTPHELRSTAATLMLLAGTPVKVAAAQTGHSVELMLKRYQAIMPDDRARAATALDTLLTTRQDNAEASTSRQNGD